MARIQLSGTQIPTLSKLNVDGELTLDAQSGTSGHMLVSQGAGNTPAWSNTLTSPTINIINAASSSTTTAELFGNVTTGTVGIADGLTTGTLNIGNGTTTVTGRTVNINTNASGSLTVTTNIGSPVIGSTINLAVGLPGVVFTSTGLISTSAVTGGNSSAMTLKTGNTTTSGNSGSLVLDVGTAAGTAGTVSLGATASGVTIGKTGTTTTINGSLSATGVPFAMAANRTTTAAGTALAVNTQETAVTVTFPTSRFSVIPAVTANTSSPRYAVAITTVSTTGFTMIVRNVSDATGTTYTYNWMAIQMTSGAVSG